jgi:alpha-beta hydrolase superfamily lysophospholipase
VSVEEQPPLPPRPRPARAPNTPAPADRWVTDTVLGEGFEARTLPLADDEEGSVVATLVRHTPSSSGLAALLPRRRRRLAVLYLHGWSDYFFQADLARFWHGLGARFYALDLRKYGRSLREHQTPGYVADIETYDEDLREALRVIESDPAAPAQLVLMGHSAGGLVASLWAHRHRGRLAGLVLNAPWLEIPGASFLRTVSTPVVEQLARLQPKLPLPQVDPGFYTRTVSAAEGGEWTVDERWRPGFSMPVRPGWLLAMLTGHARVAAGLAIDVPVLVVSSDRTVISRTWSEDMRSSDIVLDVHLVARRALELGPVVTVARVPGALHDVVRSPRPVRDRAYDEIRRWARGYLDL